MLPGSPKVNGISKSQKKEICKQWEQLLDEEELTQWKGDIFQFQLNIFTRFKGSLIGLEQNQSITRKVTHRQLICMCTKPGEQELHYSVSPRRRMKERLHPWTPFCGVQLEWFIVERFSSHLKTTLL